PAVQQETLAARRVPGRVQQFDLDIADADFVAVPVRGEIAHLNSGNARNKQGLYGIHVDGNADPFHQFGQAFQLEAHHRTAHMVGVVVGDQHAGQVHAVGLERVDQVAGRVGGVHHDAVTGLPVADQVG